MASITIGNNVTSIGKEAFYHCFGLQSITLPNSVTFIGELAFEQCAGFLRIPNGDIPLDNTAVHPESYTIVEKFATNLSVTVKELIENPSLLDNIQAENYCDSKNSIGVVTIAEIIKEIKKQGLDQRKMVAVLEFNTSLHKIEDVMVGMILPGIITNLTNFGAFVDIGIKTQGLIHLSQICDKYISTPTEVLKLHQHVIVKVVEVDIQRNRIQLSMKGIVQK
jgi:uncharacterized protein